MPQGKRPQEPLRVSHPAATLSDRRHQLVDRGRKRIGAGQKVGQAVAPVSAGQLSLRIAHHVGVKEQEVRDADVDAVRAQLDPDAVAHRLDPSLGRAVRAQSGRPEGGGARGDVQEVSPAALEVRQRRAICVHHPKQVDLDHALPCAPVLKAKWPAGGDSGVCDDDVKPTKRLGGAVHRARHLLEARHITLGHEGALAAARGYLMHPVGLEPDECQTGSQPREALSQRRADAACGAGDQHALAGQ